MRLSIFGTGYVGVVSGACLARLGHDVIAVDVNPQKVDMVNAGVSPIVEEGIGELVAEMVKTGKLRATTDVVEAVGNTSLSIVSVGTPSASNGSLSTTAVEQVSRDIGKALAGTSEPHTVAYRSTILPGTVEDSLIPILAEASGRRVGDGLDVCFNPEFLREGTSIRDFSKPPFTIVGATSDTGYKVMEDLYDGVEAPFLRTTVREAETVKYLSNLFHAVKITFANEIGAVLKSMDIDARAAMDIFCRDTELNISRAYLRPGYAFGGSCLPKDLRAFLYLANSREVSVPMLGNLLNSNQQHIERAFQMVTAHDTRKIALFGLAFKPGTDDLRESPLVRLAELLIGKGYELAIYDPYVQTAKLMGANRDFIEREIPHIERLMKNSVEEMLDHGEVIAIGHLGRDDVQTLIGRKPTAPIVDFQGIKELQDADGLTYQGICW